MITSRLSDWLDTYRSDLGTTPKILIAVSGGSDSLVLLEALHEVRKTHDLELTSATVDHGLREGSAAEADFVRKMSQSLGIPHHTLKLDWTIGENRRQAAARQKRYRALSDCARACDASFIATGHTLDDQIETVLMRLNAGSGFWGLAGMAEISPVPVWPEGYGLHIIRPVMTLTRSDLQDYLRSRNTGWVSDPSNEDTDYERVRTRRLLSGQTELWSHLLHICIEAGKMRDHACRRLTEWVNTSMEWLAGSSVRLARSSLNELTEESRGRLMQLVIATVSGREQFVDVARMKAVLDQPDLEKGLTLGGCVLREEEAHILIVPELDQSNVRNADLGRMGQVWDGRVLFKRKSASDFTPWGDQSVPQRLRTPQLPSYPVRKALPIIIGSDSRTKHVPHMESIGNERPHDLGPERLMTLLRHPTEFFSRENGRRESFSGP